MALSPPDIAELQAFAQTTYAEDETAGVTSALQQALDAFVILTAIEEFPEDETYARVVRYGIMDLALWLMVRNEHKEEINSPFSSERIGSYSYSKMMQTALRGEETSIWWLDKALGLYRGLFDTTANWSSSENVFNPQWETFDEIMERERAEIPWPEPYDFYGR